MPVSPLSDIDTAGVGHSPAEIEAFVRRHFGLLGSLRLHRAAFGLDLLRAPLNVMLSPLLFITRVMAWACRKIGLRGVANWLTRRKLLLRTSVAAQVEGLILSELVRVPLPADDQATAKRVHGALAEYSGTRTAMAEFTTALVMLLIGAVFFHTATPGAISMAPGIASEIARSNAIAGFPLGATLGAGWYVMFPVGPSAGLMSVTILGLIIIGSVIATFAGVLADPVQTQIGMHQRRLTRLLHTIEAELGRHPERPFVAREHFLARVFDLWDMAASLLRVFKG